MKRELTHEHPPQMRFIASRTNFGCMGPFDWGVGSTSARVVDLSMSERKAVTKKLAFANPNGSKTEKSRVSDDLVRLTNWQRDSARAQLRAATRPRVATPRARRSPKFRGEVLSALAVCGEAKGWSQRFSLLRARRASPWHDRAEGRRSNRSHAGCRNSH